MAAVRLQDVAAHAGVSMKTVSNVVHDYPHVSPAMRDKVRKAIEELGYRPNALGRRLATGRSGMLSLAIADISIPYFSELARAVSRAAQDRGYRLLLEQTGGTLEGERKIVSTTEAGLVDGVIFQPSLMSSLEISRHRQDVPLVLLGEGPAPITVDHVMIDNEAGAREATEQLIALGRTRIGFVGHERSGLSPTSRLRMAGYQEALERAGLPIATERVISTSAITSEAAAAAIGAALDGGLALDGLVCRDDLAAIGALRALQERGLSVPHDVAVTGWDDIPVTSFTHPSLTTVAADTDALVGAALDMLEERIAGFDGAGRHVIVDHRLVVRESAPAAS